MRLILLVLALATLAGCRSVEPSYRVQDLAFDDKLLGRWIEEPSPTEGDSATMTFDVRVVEEKDGRVNPPPQWKIFSGQAAPSGQPLKAYSITFDTHNPKDTALRLHGFLLRRDGRTFLGVQPDLSDQSRSHLVGLVLPMHFLMLLERTDDRLVVRQPSKPVAWIPWVRPVDAPAPGLPDVPDLSSVNSTDIAFCDDIDRVLRIYAANADNAGFWEQQRVYRRIAE
jgi:hypothetical protein